MNKSAFRQIAATLILTLAAAPVAATAQTMATDTAVKVGRLDNGLTYYIRHNAKDPGIAEFYIAQRVGSIQEEPHQRGLAHFLEHMAFNGTEHFPGDSTGMGIVPWCETVGIKFGTNLNAYTSVDQTVYNISSAPVAREGVLDSCLLILRDWSCGLLLTGEEIDKERGVIHEEWRTRRAGRAVNRMMENIAPKVYKGTKYEDCMPIGSMDVVDNFDYEALRDYYRRWYRPDLQGVIVVGDIDTRAVEAKIKNLFGPIPAPTDPEERVYYPVPDNDTMIVAIERDAEQPIILARLYMKRDATPDNQKDTYSYQRDGFVEWCVTYMLNQRITELLTQPDPPFISASAGSGIFFLSRTKDAFSIMAGCRQDSVQGSIAAVVGEAERARRHGFTAGELQRAKSRYLTAAERQHAERDSRHNPHYVSACVNHFLSSEPMLTEDEDLRLARDFVETVTLEEVNAATANLITDSNQVLTVYAPDKEGVEVPDERQFKEYVLQAQERDYEPYSEPEVAASLMPVPPAAGSITQEKDFGRHGATQLTLSNGIEVLVKPTDFNADQITFRLFAPGGTSTCPESDAPNFSFIASAIAEAGVGDFDINALRKTLAGKSVNCSPYVGVETQGIDASSSVRDLETMLQLAHLYFTSPRTDEEAFNSMISRRRSLFTNREANPSVTYNDSVAAALYGDNPRTRPVKLETLDSVSYDRIRQIYARLFSDASGFKAVIIGNVDLDSLKPLLCKYIASLPATWSGAGQADTYPAVRDGNETHLFTRKQATESATVSIYITADVPCTPQNDLCLDALQRVLKIAYTDSVREEKGGTYGVSVGFDLDPRSKPTAALKMSFRCDPARYDELVRTVYRQLDLVAANGPLPESLSKVKTYLTKQYAQNIITNDYWRYVIYHELRDGIDYDTGYTSMVEELTGADVQAMAAELLRQNRRIEVTMMSE